MATNVLLPLSGSSVGRDGVILNGKSAPRARQRNKESGLSPANLGFPGSVTKRGKGEEMSRPSPKHKAAIRSITQEIDPSSYRNSILHNICNDMLEKGFHQSFSELFNLVERQRADHRRAGPAAILLEPLIENNHPKLEHLRVQLTLAEDAHRAGDLDSVYMAQRNMAQYFEQSGDTWLSDHFYNRCLETGKMVKGDNGYKEGEAHCHVGLALENRGDLEKAASHMETFHHLSRHHKWHTESGDSLHDIACEHLRRIYTSIAEQVHSDDDTTAINYLKKAHEMAREGRDTYQEGLSCYRLGNVYEGIGDHDTAIQYHKRYLERCKYHNDDEGVGNAYEALSRSYESKGEIENAVKFLEIYVSVAEKAGLQHSLARACSAIGILYNTLCDYDKAVEFFGRCCQICGELEDTEALHEARVQYGIAKGHQMMGGFSSRIADCSIHALQTLVSWKDARISPELHVDVTSDVESENQETTTNPEEVGQVEANAESGESTDGQEIRKHSDTNDPTQVT